ncbi:hypothetical protein C8Q80DRAFT_1116885 [Daedaleopsis nitida]|nr:hypothetical protein C8Q80DRAFT_1116885 [Daedaleopsis nitida]
MPLRDIARPTPQVSPSGMHLGMTVRAQIVDFVLNIAGKVQAWPSSAGWQAIRGPGLPSSILASCADHAHMRTAGTPSSVEDSKFSVLVWGAPSKAALAACSLLGRGMFAPACVRCPARVAQLGEDDFGSRMRQVAAPDTGPPFLLSSLDLDGGWGRPRDASPTRTPPRPSKLLSWGLVQSLVELTVGSTGQERLAARRYRSPESGLRNMGDGEAMSTVFGMAYVL